MKKPIHYFLMLLLATSVIVSCKKSNSNEEVIVPDKELLGKTPTAVPQTLFLILSETENVQLVKDGNVFGTTNYVPLEVGKTYKLNTKADGTGTSYFVKDALSAYDYANDDKIVWDDPLLEVVQGKGGFIVARNQAYKLSFDFSNAKLTWEYYNVKLFYYTDWEVRTEVLMDYKHPLTFEKTLSLPANNYMKFYSVNPDWYEWGAASATSLTGALSLFGGEDITAVTEAASYKVSITLNNNLENGTYAFRKQ